jgi:hypothetical protein
MSHVYLISGAAAQGGTVGAQHLNLTYVQNVNIIGSLHLEYVAKRNLTLTKVANANVISAKTLSHITVRTLTQTKVANANAFGALTLALLPFEPENAETTDLLNFFDQTYINSDKIQIDTLISRLKSAGVWAKFDWYGNAHWAKSEHDALVNWRNVAQSLVKVGSASWSMGVGLSGTTPTSNSRYKSGWNVGDGAHSSATNFAFFSNITVISAPQNGMQPMGVWKRITGGGPSTPDGVFLDLDITGNTGFAGAFLMNGNGNTSLVPGSGVGVWGVSHNGASQITVKDGVTQETDTVSGSADYTDPDGMSVAGSAGLARRSFPGTQIYWGWGGALSAAEFAAIEAAYQTALAPPLAPVDALFVDDSDHVLFVDDDDNYLQINDSGENQTAPSYSNPGGSGDRRGNIIWGVSVPINSANKDWDDLVDGVNTATASGLFWDITSGAAEFIVDFIPLGKTQLMTEFKWYQSGTNTHGVWQVSGSDDGITWTDIDLPFTLGGATVQTVRLSNVYSYRMYRFKKVSGSTSSGPFLYEIEFKIGGHRTLANIPTYSTNVPGAITVTNSTGLFGSGTGANLVNGNTTENTTFFNGLISTGFLKFDFGAPVVIAEARWYQNTAASHGVWKWQGSNDDSTYTDLAAVPANSEIFGTGSGGSPRKLHGFGGNTVAYRYYKLVQLTSTTSNGPFTREMEFRKV